MAGLQAPNGYFSTEALATLSEKLSSITFKWDELGHALGVSHAFIQGLYPKEPGHVTIGYLTQTLSWWLRNPKSATEPNTVRLLLKKVEGLNLNLAKRIEKEITLLDEELTDAYLGVLCEKLHEIAPQWKLLGRRLKVPENELEAICPSNGIITTENMCQVLLEWVRNTKKPTLVRLCKALESEAIGEKGLCDSIKKDKEVTKLLLTD